MTAPDPRRLHGRKTFLLLLGIALVPLLAAQAAYQWWRPEGGDSFGKLIVMPEAFAAAPQWRLVAHDPAGCTPLREKLAFAARQFAVGQGREADRLHFGSSQACAGPALQEHIVSAPRLALPGPGLYLVDPNGNAVTQYTPQQLDDVEGRRRTMSEIGKFLKNNRGLG
ncbi:hypothetical protein N8I74_02740 [Chitiniphilus purpureus]|uniref:Transmembrane protein n=1 Tax=Chitiniphilus purpureus TaxID=2981137 RepID=A0ABY6DNN4_9NEIS|nr:hypothetical protein [Chitiniphilus sp. CD1]UXY15952.1 hypothetical protein N8I74_02740 [Chitiniphilus sp. CD1]